MLGELFSNPYVIGLLSLFGVSGLSGLIVLVARTLANYFITVNNIDKVGDAIRKKLAKYAAGGEKDYQLARILAMKVEIIATELAKECKGFLVNHPQKKS